MTLPRPIIFECRHETTRSLGEIVQEILVLENWTTFTGWGPLPGIRSASFEKRTADLLGTRVRVLCTNGDTYIETITRWEVDQLLEIRMDEFTAPLSRLATHFIERWATAGNRTAHHRHTVVRSFELHPKSMIGRLGLVPVGFMMKRAVTQHSRRVLP